MAADLNCWTFPPCLVGFSNNLPVASFVYLVEVVQCTEYCTFYFEGIGG